MVDDTTLTRIDEAADTHGLQIDLDKNKTRIWIGAIRIAEARSKDEIKAEMKNHDLRREEKLVRRLALVLGEVFAFRAVPDNAIIYRGPDT